MRVYLDKGDLFTNLGVLIALVLLPILACVADAGSVMRTVCINAEIACVLYLPLFMIFSYRRCSYAVIEPAVIHSHSMFGRAKCRVDLNETVYYVQFEAKSLFKDDEKYIAISNQVFRYQPYGAHNLTFLQTYDQKSIIAMPYNDKTKELLDTEHWANVQE